eukprot:6172873-Pleurochrysis_carterae.AAC.3
MAIEADYLLAFLPSRPTNSQFDPLARPTVTYELSSRAHVTCNSTLTCTVGHFRLASHAYSRSARALLPMLVELCSRWPQPTYERLPRATP